MWVEKQPPGYSKAPLGAKHNPHFAPKGAIESPWINHSTHIKPLGGQRRLHMIILREAG